MKVQTLWRKLAASLPGIFIFETLAMSLVLVLIFGPHVKRWGVFFEYSAGLGLIMTVIVKIIAVRSFHSLGLTNVKQVWALKDAMAANVPPSDPALLDALPKYLARGGEQIDKLRKDYKKTLIMFGALTLISILGHALWSLVFLFFIGLTVYVHNGLDKREEKIRAYCVTLEGKGVKIIPKIEALQKKRETTRKKSKGWSVPS